MNFRDAALEVIRKEGGSVLHQVKNDRGGLTKYGISQRSYPKLDIAKLTLDDAIAIYKRDFWDKINGDKIKLYSIAFAIFDQAVNRGPATAIKQAQKVVSVKSDGIPGAQTLNAINAISERDFLKRYLELSKDAYQKIVDGDSSQGIFLKGWNNRLSEIEKYASTYLGRMNTSTAIGSGAVILATAFFLIFFLNQPKRRSA